MIQNESRDLNGGNVRLFSAATCTSQCNLRSLCANAHQSILIYTFRVSSLTPNCNGVFEIKAYTLGTTHRFCKTTFQWVHTFQEVFKFLDFLAHNISCSFPRVSPERGKMFNSMYYLLVRSDQKRKKHN